jgi:hypothetical protein
MRKKEVEITLTPNQFNRLDILIKQIIFQPKYRQTDKK